MSSDAQPETLSEGTSPDEGQELSENEVPRESRVFKERNVPGTHDQQTRKLLAVIVLGLLGALYLGVFFFYLRGKINIDQFTAAIAGLSGPQALAAAAIGFYYGAKQ